MFDRLVSDALTDRQARILAKAFVYRAQTAQVKSGAAGRLYAPDVLTGEAEPHVLPLAQRARLPLN